MLRIMSMIVVLSTLLSFQLYASGCIKGDCRNGYGTYEFPSGARYIGNFLDGKAHGKGILYFSNGNKYIGHWQQNHREGMGRLVYEQGHEYLGNFKYDKRSGKGKMSYNNGDQYEGNWQNDQPNGEGKYSFKGGDRYEGTFSNGRFEGKGTIFYADGSKFSGAWKENKKHGSGIFHLNNGQKLTGEWAAGRYMGKEENLEIAAPAVATAEVNTEETHRSYLRDCNRESCASGHGFYIYADGSRFEGNFKNGYPEGRGTTFYASGDKYIGEWKDHAPHGRGIMHFSNGRVLGAKWHYGKATAELAKTNITPSTRYTEIEESNDVKIWAVVVGIGAYNHMPSLRYTDDDAYQFYAFLKSPEGGALTENQIRILIDENATRANIINSMNEVLLKADENDVVLFYFSGHGLEGSFVPVDFDGFNNKLEHEEIKNILKKSQAKHKLVIGDACHSGSLLAMKAPVHSTLKKFYKAFDDTKGGLALMMSSKSEEVSLEDSGLRSGIFSYYLIKGLKGAADSDENDIVSVSELFNYVYHKVRKYTAHAQTPTMTGDYDRGMPVGVVRD